MSIPYYCCKNTLPFKEGDIIKCINCNKFIGKLPPITKCQPKMDDDLIQEIKNEIEQLSTCNKYNVSISDFTAIKNEFKRLNFTKEKIKHCQRITVKNILKNVKLSKYDAFIENIRDQLITEPW